MPLVDFYSLIQINLLISFISFSFYLALITKKYVSIENRNSFEKDLLVAREQLPNNALVTYFPLFISMQNIIKIRSYFALRVVETFWLIETFISNQIN